MKEKWTELKEPVRQHQADNMEYALWAMHTLKSQNEKRERKGQKELSEEC